MRRSLTQLFDPQAAADWRSTTAQESFAVWRCPEGGQLTVLGQNVLLNSVDVGTVLLVVDTSNVLNLQGTVSFAVATAT